MSFVLLTFDVEDWFQVENFKASIPFSSWPSRELRVERNTHLLLDFLDSVRSTHPNRTLTATFFVLGWIAERVPGLVREIRARGHEVASHGYNHNLCTRHSTKELRKDLQESKKLLEDISGTEVLGYRAPSFSITEKTLAILEESGYMYDSSFNSFGANHRYGKIRIFPYQERIWCKTSRNIYELPISNLQIGKCTIPVGGGAYFRLIPVRFFTKMVLSILKNRNAYLFYLHPWETDTQQPRVAGATALSRFRHYTNISITLDKLSFFLDKIHRESFVSCSDYIQRTSMDTPYNHLN